ncbi:DUF3445 domain-containing protein [Shimia sp. R10_1]|uniref:heme-dependent oxidative N-demethylase family protein n=1 Tax=Shimia sp. R10_1 TaxID=2821095 RepID=UPI001ADAC1B3|nr:DUF3445 domain-containing protein [Shimia sp. R10_1]MBO9471963.1 DUF3445 domain-containing protein [Shimia sp. R10_1]
MKPILQSHIPYDALAEKALPGIAPLPLEEWLLIDEAYAAQMALRCDLLERCKDDVTRLDPGALVAAQEVLQNVLDVLADRTDFGVSAGQVVCPDGRVVILDWDNPMETLGQLIQEDICLLHKQGHEHVLTGAVLCFPASWTLAEKIGKPLIGIHTPVPEYDANIAKRVQRLFDGVRVGRPLWRKNALWYDDPTLFTPRSETAPRSPVTAKTGAYLRSERQSMLRLPKSGAVVFAIHTFVVRRADVLGDDCAPK